jgi:GMP synthase-like glutamine amidotransferase
LAGDPAFEGLPREFEVMESHCGQVAYIPKDWCLIATKGPGGRTKNQCFQVKDRYIYGAQFHIEMEGTRDNSCRIMANFLSLSRQWGGYNPNGKSVSPPRPLAE